MTTASLRSRPAGFVAGSSRLTLRERARRVVQYRRILKLLVSRDLKVRYAGSVLGYVWTILEPLLMSLVYFFMFTQVLHRNAGPEFSPFLLYLVTGQLPFFWFTGSVNGTARALRAEAQMVRSTNVPRELWVLRVICSRFVEYFFGLPVVIVFAVSYMMKPTIYVFLLPLAWAMELVLVLGMGLILAPLNVLVRDVERIIPIFLRIMFYSSPVLYSITQAPASLRSVYTYNPAVGFLILSRAMFFPDAIHERKYHYVGGHTVFSNVHTVMKNGEPTVAGTARIVGGRRVEHVISHWNWVWHSGVSAVVLLFIGAFVFMRLERHVLKEI